MTRREKAEKTAKGDWYDPETVRINGMTLGRKKVCDHWLEQRGTIALSEAAKQAGYNSQMAKYVADDIICRAYLNREIQRRGMLETTLQVQADGMAATKTIIVNRGDDTEIIERPDHRVRLMAAGQVQKLFTDNAQALSDVSRGGDFSDLHAEIMVNVPEPILAWMADNNGTIPDENTQRQLLSGPASDEGNSSREAGRAG